MGHILNNKGVGPGPTFQAADQVRKITDTH